MSLTHRDIAPAANRGEDADAGNLYTFPGAPSRYSGDGWGRGSWMPRGMAQALDALAAAGIRAEQTIVSFNTPIAMKFGSVWIMAETNYSARTSQQINKLLPGYRRAGISGRIERVPGDISAAELRRVIDGLQTYSLPCTKSGFGTWSPGPNYTTGA